MRVPHGRKMRATRAGRVRKAKDMTKNFESGTGKRIGRRPIGLRGVARCVHRSGPKHEARARHSPRNMGFFGVAFDLRPLGSARASVAGIAAEGCGQNRVRGN